jgi:hypothetical protein
MGVGAGGKRTELAKKKERKKEKSLICFIFKPRDFVV